MERYLLRKTMDYESMVDLFVRSGLEISPEDPRPEGLITCFELVDVQENKRIGASGFWNWKMHASSVQKPNITTA